MAKEFDKDNPIFRLDDLFKIRNVSHPAISPDGNQIACVITHVNEPENCRDSQIALISVKDKKTQILAGGETPVWSPDGHSIAFDARRDGKSGICIYNVMNNRERFLIQTFQSSYFINHLEDKKFCWSPDGRYIAYVGTASFSPSEDNDVRVINRLLYKSKGGRGRSYFADEQLFHVWIVPVNGGEPELITDGDYNEHSISWSPDGKEITFLSNHSEFPDNNQFCDLWKVNIKTKKITRLTSSFGTVYQPRWSPDGKNIAFLGTTSKINTNDSMSEDTHLYLIPETGGVPFCLTKSLDRRVENIQWHPNGDSIFFTAGDHGMTPLLKIFIKSREIETIVGGKCHILEYSFDAKAENIAYLKTDPTHPPEIFLIQKNQQEAIKVTNENESFNTCSLQDTEEFWVKSFDEILVQGWIMRPASFDPTKTYPVILVIHGGPHNMFGYDFEERFHALSAYGYAVLFMNPRGSHGYGQLFSNGNLLNWGGGDYQDLMAGVDYAIDKYSWIDKERIGVTGQSYGGYMSNWIITQTNRFRAAVVDGGISNLISFAGTSLYHSLIESEFNGSAYDNFELLWQWSPLRNVKNVRTPTLFLHGELDNEVPVSQAEEMYVALKKSGVKTEFIQYKGEGHGWRPDLKPKSRYDLYHRMINWFDQYLGTVKTSK